MTTWSGWATDFLAAASLPNSAANLRFMDSWAANANHPGCGNNPIDLTHRIANPASASSKCAATAQVGMDVQRYSSHTWARTAWDVQIRSSRWTDIRAALESRNPYTVSDPAAVATAIGDWTSTKFANVYLAAAQATGSGNVRAPHALGGWSDLQRTVNHGLPTMLRQVSGLNRATSNALARRRRVGH